MKYYTEDWVYNCMEFNRLNKDKEYHDYSHKYLPDWYNKFSFHDSGIISVDENSDLMTLNMVFGDINETKYQLRFYNPIIIEECKLENTSWLADELYLTDDGGCEFHFMIDDFTSGERELGFFTLRCSRMELIFRDKVYSVGKETY